MTTEQKLQDAVDGFLDQQVESSFLKRDRQGTQEIEHTDAASLAALIKAASDAGLIGSTDGQRVVAKRVYF